MQILFLNLIAPASLSIFLRTNITFWLCVWYNIVYDALD